MLTAAIAAWAGEGELQPRVWCERSAGHSYALYLPSSWTPERRWPLLVVLDPRGRALPALERFREAAEEQGFVVASSWDSASDRPEGDPTPAAVAAMLGDLPARAHTAPDQVVLAGFSGTARSAWAIGEAAPEIVSGVIAAGGATADGRPPEQAPPFVWAGSAGTTDFNYGEVRLAAQRLRELGHPGRLELFEGAHEWPPHDVLARSLAWVAGDERGPPEVPESALEDRLILQERQALQRLELVADWLRDTGRAPPGVLRARTMLQAKALERTAQRHAGTPRGNSALRTLALFDAELGFYVAREHRDRENHPRVLATMKIAATTGPAEATELYNLACAHARLGEREEALEALTRAIQAGFADVWQAERDPDLQSLRGHPRLQALLDGIELRPRDPEGVFGFLGVSPGLESRRGEFAEAVAQASLLVDAFAAQHGWKVERLWERVEIWERQEELWARILELSEPGPAAKSAAPEPVETACAVDLRQRVASEGGKHELSEPGPAAKSAALGPVEAARTVDLRPRAEGIGSQAPATKEPAEVRFPERADRRVASEGGKHELHGLPDAPLPTPTLVGALENGVLLAVTPEAQHALAPTPQRDAWTRLLAHEMLHRLHVEILQGDEEAMGPRWFFEGFAVLGSGQQFGTEPVVRCASEALLQVHDTSPSGAYARYGAALRYLAGQIPLQDLVANAGRPDFEDWLLDRIPPCD